MGTDLKKMVTMGGDYENFPTKRIIFSLNSIRDDQKSPEESQRFDLKPKGQHQGLFYDDQIGGCRLLDRPLVWCMIM
jgi:hypothetical protein